MSGQAENGMNWTADTENGHYRREANCTVLTPLLFLKKASMASPERTAIVYGNVRRNYRETYRRCCAYASALNQRGIGQGNTVAIIAPNTPALYESHFGIAMAGAVINPLNIRLDAKSLAQQIEYGEACIFLVDPQFAEVARAALSMVRRQVLVIDIEDPAYAPDIRVGELTYEELLAEGDPLFDWALPSDEFAPISLSFTSGTTGMPKGVVANHRGVCINAFSQLICWNVQQYPVYLWTLPMFHCNGWGFAWSIAAKSGVNVFMRKFDPERAATLILQEKVTHLCGVPIVYDMLLKVFLLKGLQLSHTVNGIVGGAALSVSTIKDAAQVGLELVHGYGLTETYGGPALFCYKQEDWSELPLMDQARLNARQGLVSLGVQDVAVISDLETMTPLVADGVSVGEVMIRGNAIMSGYFKDEKATDAAFAGGWFHTGDLAVMDPDGYVRIVDRAKDIIVSGGENISSMEIEVVLLSHPLVEYAAVVAKPDSVWGEVPCAFIQLRSEQVVSEMDILEHCRKHLAGFKMPKAIVFGVLPRTATGKVQKHELRRRIADFPAEQIFAA